MSNIAQRLFLFFVGVPALVGIILFLPSYRHGATAALIIVFSAGSGIELGQLFKAKNIHLSTWQTGLIGALVPSFFYFSLVMELPVARTIGIQSIALSLLVIIVLGPFALIKKERIDGALFTASAYGFSIIYPGLLAGFIILIVAEPLFGAESILSFILMTFGNDSLAWLFGNLFGKRKNLIPVSPNKSLAGFLGGLIGSILGAITSKFLFPSVVSVNYFLISIMGIIIGLAVIAGDLFESALKRSAGIKDSGNLIPGRGGFLDSFDSLLFAAPIFYAASFVLGIFR